MRYALDAKAEQLGEVRLFRHCTPKELAKLASVTDEVDAGGGKGPVSAGRGREGLLRHHRGCC